MKIEKGQVWRNNKHNNEYFVVGWIKNANNGYETAPPEVCYKPVGGGALYYRKESEFIDKFTFIRTPL